MYSTLSELVAVVGAEELAQLCDKGVPRLLTAELLQAAVEGQDLSSYTEGEQSTAQKALSLLTTAVEDASAEVNARIGQKYSLPLASPPQLLRRLTQNIARFLLWTGQEAEHVRHVYEASLKTCERVGTGELALGADFPMVRIHHKAAERELRQHWPWG